MREWCKNSGPYVDGSAFRGRDASLDWASVFTPPTITVDLNIVYDSSQMNEASAREAMKDNIAELQRAFGQIYVEFNVTFTAGSSNEDRTSIATGAVEGAINVFLYDNTKSANVNGSYYIPENRQIFLTKVAGGKFREGGGILHELGHLFRGMVNGDPRSGVPVPVKTSEGWIWGDAANYTEDWIINSTNDFLLSGRANYQADFTPGSYSSSLWATAKVGEMAPRTEKKPTALQILRQGAWAVAAQRVRR